MRRFLIILAAWLIAFPAFAQKTNIIGGGIFGDGKPSSGYNGPGDLTTFTAWYSCSRAYSAAYATSLGLACNLRNTSTNETCDFPVTAAGAIGVAANCSLTSNGASLATFCTLGCAVTEAYDQTGNGRNVVQATGANQPTLVLSCVNSLPCLNYASSSSQGLQSSGNFTPASGLVSFSLVAEKVSGGSSGFATIRENGTSSPNRFGTTATVNSWGVSGTGTVTGTAADAAAHSATGVLNGASSVIAIDGTETTGSATGSTTAGLIIVLAPSTSTAAVIQMVEGGFADNAAFSSTVRTNLCHNMRLAYATSGSC